VGNLRPLLCTHSDISSFTVADEFFCSMSSPMHTDEELSVFQRKFLETRTQAHLIQSVEYLFHFIFFFRLRMPDDG
jgi:hypothetical protein